MSITRRSFLQTTGMGIAALGSASTSQGADTQRKIKIGMCDWNLRDEQNRGGGSANPEFIKYAAKAGLDGIQVSVATSPDNVPLRDPKVIEQYKQLGEEHQIEFSSVAAGSILNSIPLASEPQSTVYVIDALEAANRLGSSNILAAFFGNGDLRLKDARGNLRNISKDEQYSEYELDTLAVTRLVEVLRQLVPRARDQGVVIGLENTLTAKQNLEIIDRVGSPEWVKVYYDIGNSWSNGYNVPEEIRMLGNEMICEIHLKDNGKDVSVFTSKNSMVNWEEVKQALQEIKYDKWYVIEESGRENRFFEDTKESIEHVKPFLV
ncbi:MAG: sugar phosphate isomerase/epimerase family protein [bacterium]|jgi:L-ribulose-5-phosphate 3-epimerase